MSLEAKSIHGIRYCILESGEYRFSATDVATKFGFENSHKAVEELCETVYTDVLISGARYTISFDGMISLARHSTSLTEEFVDSLFKITQENRLKIENQPNFDDPIAAEKSWRHQYELRKMAEAKVQELKEILGDGKQFKIVRAIPWVEDMFNTKNIYIYSVLGNLLSRLSQKMNKSVRECRAFGYSKSVTKKMYHIEVIETLRNQLETDPSRLEMYRRKHFVRILH